MTMLRIQDQADVVEVGNAFEGGYLSITAGSRGNDWGEVSLTPASVDLLIAHLIEVRGAYRVLELLEDK